VLTQAEQEEVITVALSTGYGTTKKITPGDGEHADHEGE
jgi:hypothetical protein